MSLQVLWQRHSVYSNGSEQYCGIVDETVVVRTFAGVVTVVWILVESEGGAVLLNVEPGTPFVVPTVDDAASLSKQPTSFTVVS
jgi:hypothetical protein